MAIVHMKGTITSGDYKAKKADKRKQFEKKPPGDQV